MRYCVLKGTTTVIDGSLNDDDIMLQNALNAGYISEQTEIITQAEYDARKVLEPQAEQALTETQLLGQQMSEREINEILMGQQISDIEIRLMLGGL